MRSRLEATCNRFRLEKNDGFVIELFPLSAFDFEVGSAKMLYCIIPKLVTLCLNA